MLFDIFKFTSLEEITLDSLLNNLLGKVIQITALVNDYNALKATGTPDPKN